MVKKKIYKMVGVDAMKYSVVVDGEQIDLGLELKSEPMITGEDKFVKTLDVANLKVVGKA